jgi:hypothetical protein
VTAKDTSRPGPVANLVFAALWFVLLVGTLATPSSGLVHRIQVIGYVVLNGYFVTRAVRLLRARP